jgi:hypothetical protein
VSKLPNAASGLVASAFLTSFCEPLVLPFGRIGDPVCCDLAGPCPAEEVVDRGGQPEGAQVETLLLASLFGGVTSRGCGSAQLLAGAGIAESILSARQAGDGVPVVAHRTDRAGEDHGTGGDSGTGGEATEATDPTEKPGTGCATGTVPPRPTARCRPGRSTSLMSKTSSTSSPMMSPAALKRGPRPRRNALGTSRTSVRLRKSNARPAPAAVTGVLSAPRAPAAAEATAPPRATAAAPPRSRSARTSSPIMIRGLRSSRGIMLSASTNGSMASTSRLRARTIT